MSTVTASSTAAAPRTGQRFRTITTQIPSRLDRLPWSQFHWRIVIGLGTVWVLDGLEVTIVGAIAPRLTEAGSGISMTSADVGFAAALYVAGACLGALLFGQLTDRHGRKKLFMVTLALYIGATVLTAFAFAPWYFFVCRFFTGMGIGGEYAAINSAIDELIPAKNRGRVDIAINGSFWVGAAAGGLAALLLLDPAIFPRDVGWRLAFGAGAILGLGILIVRRHVPESPRWLFLHGREEEAERIVARIEEDVRRETGAELPPPADPITVRQRDAIPFRELARAIVRRYPTRAILGLALFVGQAFLYNAVTFDLGTILHDFFGVGSSHVPYLFVVFAGGNFLGPLFLGRLFDTVGRIPMIAGTYLGSAAMVALLGILLRGGHLTTVSFMALVVAAFFLASAGASSAYLTVSEVFPMETRALAIALFYAVGTAVGGIAGPVIFGALIHSGDATKVATGFFIGAAAMAIGGLAELRFGVRAEQQSLENIARPLTAEEVEAEDRGAVDGGPPAGRDGAADRDRYEALALRESAAGLRAAAARHRAARHEVAAGVGSAPPGGLVVLESRAQIAELRALALDERAQAREQRAAARAASFDAVRREVLDRAARSEERARDHDERADALAAGHAVGPDGPPEPGTAEHDAAELRWAQARSARERADTARARHDAAGAAHEDEDAHTHGQLALAAEERADAAGHDAVAKRLHAQLMNDEPGVRRRIAAERDARIDARRARARAGMRRFRPGVGTVFFSPAMAGSAGTSSRFAAIADEAHDREVEAIARSLDEVGAAGREDLRRRVGGRHWGPGRFAAALRAALREGRVRRDSQGRYETTQATAAT
jgi:MFS family permease